MGILLSPGQAGWSRWVKTARPERASALPGRGVAIAGGCQAATRRIVESWRIRADASPVVRVSGRRLNARRLIPSTAPGSSPLARAIRQMVWSWRGVAAPRDWEGVAAWWAAGTAGGEVVPLPGRLAGGGGGGAATGAVAPAPFPSGTDLVDPGRSPAHAGRAASGLSGRSA
jgi:hypothetical protein